MSCMVFLFISSQPPKPAIPLLFFLILVKSMPDFKPQSHT